MPKRALTAAAVEKLKPPASGQADHFDSGYPGLALRVSAGGRKSWTLFYRAQGKQRRLGLGMYPGMGLADAREAWRTARAAVEAGRDPATEKAAAKRRQPDTVRAVGEQFIEKWHRPRNRTADEVARILERSRLSRTRRPRHHRPSPGATSSTCSTPSRGAARSGGQSGAGQCPAALRLGRRARHHRGFAGDRREAAGAGNRPRPGIDRRRVARRSGLPATTSASRSARCSGCSC